MLTVSWCLSFRLYAPAGWPGTPDLGPVALDDPECHFLHSTKRGFVQRYGPKEMDVLKNANCFCKSLYIIHTDECWLNAREKYAF